MVETGIAMLRDKKLFLLDIDGTVCRGDSLIDGALAFFDAVEAIGGKYIFITNNTTKSVKDYILFFDGLGVHTDESNFITASVVTADYLNKNYRGKLIYVFGTKSFAEELREQGVNATTDSAAEGIACVLVAYNSELTYQGITDVCRILSCKNTDYIATNPDLVCPTDFGFVPDCGSICQMLGNAVKREPVFLGKPAPSMIELAVTLQHCSKEETLVVGDRLYTDILCGYRAGVETALVLTGEATERDAGEYLHKPNYIFSSIRELHDEWRRGT